MRGGLDKAMPAFESPVLRDPFFWLFIGTLAGWAAFLWLLFA
jgi:hypothetical protein